MSLKRFPTDRSFSIDAPRKAQKERYGFSTNPFVMLDAVRATRKRFE